MAKITPKHYAQAWYSALTEATPEQWSTISNQFLEYIYKSGHLHWLTTIVAFIEQTDYAARGVQPVRVETARTLPHDTVQYYLHQLFPQGNLEVHTTVNDDLLGGLRVETANHRWNISMRGQLQQLAQNFSTDNI